MEQPVPSGRTILAAICAFWPLAAAAADAPAASIEREVTALVWQLKADEQALRAEAQERLVALGLPAVPGIERAAGGAELDQLPYLISALERMFVAGCLPAADAAELALDRLSQSDRRAVAGRATAVLTGNQQLRERRAVAALRELGADVLYDPALSQEAGLLVRAWPLGSSSEVVIPGHQLTKIEVWLHDDLAGGEEALRHVTRLEHNWSVRTWGITIYNISGNGIPADAVHRLAARLNKASIQDRGAQLGISCIPSSRCQIQNVLPNGAADRAGLERGDEVLAIDGEPVPTFEHLVAKLLERGQGESATLTISRFGNAPRDVEVTLGNWRPVVAARQREIEAQSSATMPSLPDQFPFVPDIEVK